MTIDAILNAPLTDAFDPIDRRKPRVERKLDAMQLPGCATVNDGRCCDILQCRAGRIENDSVAHASNPSPYGLEAALETEIVFWDRASVRPD
jgi:hypothetical protein